MTFDKNKKYIFSRDKWLMDTGNVLRYQANPVTRQIVDKADGSEISEYRYDDTFGLVSGMNGLLVARESCDIAEPNRNILRLIDKEMKRRAWKDLITKLNELEDSIEVHKTSIFILENEQRRLLERLKRLEMER